MMRSDFTFLSYIVQGYSFFSWTQCTNLLFCDIASVSDTRLLVLGPYAAASSVTVQFSCSNFLCQHTKNHSIVLNCKQHCSTLL